MGNNEKQRGAQLVLGKFTVVIYVNESLRSDPTYHRATGHQIATYNRRLHNNDKLRFALGDGIVGDAQAKYADVLESNHVGTCNTIALVNRFWIVFYWSTQSEQLVTHQKRTRNYQQTILFEGISIHFWCVFVVRFSHLSY